MISSIGNIFCIIVSVFCIATMKIANKKEESNTEKNDKFYNIGLIIIILIYITNTFLGIGNVPYGLHVDEAGALYDAICLSNYGTDRYLNKLPVYLINFGGGQSALYAYLAALIIKIFGVSITAFRLPSFLLGLASIVCLYKISEKSNKKLALFSAFILAIAPWHIMKCRWGLDANLMSSLLIISIYVFLKAIESNKKYLYILSGITWGLSLYTYAISYVVVPVILIISIVYLLLIKKIKIQNIIIMAIPLFLFALPLMIMLAYNNGLIENVENWIFTIPKLWRYRASEISISNIPNNKDILEILFIKDFLNYNSISAFGTLYKMSIPLVICGLIYTIKEVGKNIKQKEFSADFIILISFFAVLLIGLCLTELNINKINAIYIPMIYFAGKFLYYISKKIKDMAIIIIVLYFISNLVFMNYYYTDFAKSDLRFFESGIMYASEKAESLQKEKIYVEDCVEQTYIYTLIKNPISPYEFNSNLHLQGNKIKGYGKYIFDIPNEVDFDAVYIIKNNSQMISKLILNGFEIEEFEEFKVLWKK